MDTSMKQPASSTHQTVSGLEVIVLAAVGGALGAFLAMYQTLGISVATLGVSGLSAIGIGSFAAVGFLFSKKPPAQ